MTHKRDTVAELVSVAQRAHADAGVRLGREQEQRSWHWYEYLPFWGVVALLASAALRTSPDDAWAWAGASTGYALLAITAWGFALRKDGRLGRAARRLAEARAGRVLGFLLLAAFIAWPASIAVWLLVEWGP